MRIIIRPFRFLYCVALTIIAFSYFGWGGVLLVALALFDVELKTKPLRRSIL